MSFDAFWRILQPKLAVRQWEDLSMSKRAEFLNLIWRPYPAAPADALSLAQAVAKAQPPTWIGGEILQLREEGGHFRLTLMAQGQQRDYFGTHLLLYPEAPAEAKGSRAKVVDGFELLRPGDKVVVREVDGLVEVILLAPALNEFARGTLTAENARMWQDFLRDGRAHFTKRGFIEISTPTLVPCPGYEPTLEPFSTELHWGRKREKLFLPTSPEIHLKKMLARGWSEIFEFRSCFRNDEFSPHHQPEFTMLEWYRSYCGLDQLKQDVQELFQELSGKENLQFVTYSVADLFRELLDFELRPETSLEEVRALADRLAILSARDEDWNDIFHRIWLERIDPWIAEQLLPMIVTDYPPSQAALARLGANGWAERLEVYWRGLEIANGYHELNDANEQRRRSDLDLERRKILGRTATPNDEEFLRALGAGVAPGVGIALGVERLFMAIHGIADIRSLKAFPR